MLLSSLWSLNVLPVLIKDWRCQHGLASTFLRKRSDPLAPENRLTLQEERVRSEHCEVLVRITERPRASCNPDRFCVSSAIAGSDCTMKSKSTQVQKHREERQQIRRIQLSLLAAAMVKHSNETKLGSANSGGAGRGNQSREEPCCSHSANGGKDGPVASKPRESLCETPQCLP